MHLKITKSKKNQFFGNVDITNNMFEVLEMENRAVENRKEEKPGKPGKPEKPGKHKRRKNRFNHTIHLCSCL